MPIDLTYRGVPALVLGGSGFIGAWTARALHAHGAEVTVAARDAARATAALGPAARVLVSDLADPKASARLIDAAQPAVVFNLAGYGVDQSERDPERMTALNARLATELCDALNAQPDPGWAGQRLIHAGSALEYGRLEGTLRESADVNPTTDYGRTKLQGTQAIASCSVASGLRAVVARLFTVYGPGEHGHRLLPSLVHTARTGAPLPLTSGRQPRNFTYVEDVAEGLLRLGVSAAEPGEVVNLATTRVAPVREFVETAASVLGIDPALLDFGALPEREEEMWHGEVDVARLRSLTSWLPPTSIAEGIRRTWEWTNAR